MRGRHTAGFPKFKIISPIAPVMFFLTMPLIVIGVSPKVIFLISGSVLIAELFSRIFLGMPPVMAFRRIMRGIVGMLIFKGLKNSPVSWNKRHWPMSILLVLVMFSAANDSYAQFRVTDSMRWDREWSQGAVGTGPESIIEAFCRDCPLDIALSQILPKDFNYFVSREIGSKKINFTGAKPWGIILSDVAVANDLKVEIMRHNNRVLVENAPKNQGGVSVVALLPNRQGFFENKSWELIPGDTLKASLERWAASEGWSVIYGLETDVNIDVYAKFSGNLFEAIKQMLEAYRSVGLLSRVTMRYSHANTAIRISLASDGVSE